MLPPPPSTRPIHRSNLSSASDELRLIHQGKIFLKQIKWICPNAPTHPTALTGGFPCTAWFDVREISEDSLDDWEDLDASNTLHSGDVAHKADIERSFRSADCVCHLASYGMSGKEMLQFGRVDEMNINGTCHVLEACVELEIQRLVYVSTYNVVYGGKEIVNGNENLSYFPLDEHVDPYGRSKSIAEQLVLKRNGCPLKEKKGKNLYTCAVRPAAIYGREEDRHLPRIVSLAKLGLLLFKVGEPTVKIDWISVDNLVYALILASMGLLNDISRNKGQPVAAVQPYFVSDGENPMLIIKIVFSVSCE